MGSRPSARRRRGPLRRPVGGVCGRGGRLRPTRAAAHGGGARPARLLARRAAGGLERREGGDRVGDRALALLGRVALLGCENPSEGIHLSVQVRWLLLAALKIL